MSSSIPTISGTRVHTQTTRARQTTRPVSRFTEVLRTGADVLLAGAGAATSLVGGPLLSAAIGAARAGLARSGTGQSGATSPLSSTGSGSSELEAMRKLQQEGQQFNMQYLMLQQEAQQSNRRFSVASNILKAKHDTARAAISNIRV